MTISNRHDLAQKQAALDDIRKRISRLLTLQRKLESMIQLLDVKQKEYALEIALAECHPRLMRNVQEMTPLDADLVQAALDAFNG